MKEIPLTKGKVAIVDDEDYERLSKYKWRASPSNATFYAMHNQLGFSVIMHREITGALKGEDVHHVDDNGLNNQRCNLKRMTRSQHRTEHPCGKSPTGNTSAYRGVSWDTKVAKWQSQIRKSRRSIHLGYFEREEVAAATYDEAAKYLFGNKARLNGINGFQSHLRWIKDHQGKLKLDIKSKSTSGYWGVHWNTKEKVWRAKIQAGGRLIQLGRFQDKAEAAQIYNEAAIKFHGERAKLNEV